MNALIRCAAYLYANAVDSQLNAGSISFVVIVHVNPLLIIISHKFSGFLLNKLNKTSASLIFLELLPSSNKKNVQMDFSDKISCT